MKATKAQIARLMTVYHQLAAHEVGVDNDRASRMQWASQLLGRTVDSFSSLTVAEATRLIDAAQAAAGKVFPLRPKLSGKEARRAGTDGRKDTAFDAAPQMIAAYQVEMIERLYLRLDWTRAHFEAWLERKQGSPLRGRKQIRTVADGNKVIWALKCILRDRGLWNEEVA